MGGDGKQGIRNPQVYNINTWNDGDDLYRGGIEKQVSGKKIQHSDAGMLSLKTWE